MIKPDELNELPDFVSREVVEELMASMTPEQTVAAAINQLGRSVNKMADYNNRMFAAMGVLMSEENSARQLQHSLFRSNLSQTTLAIAVWCLLLLGAVDILRDNWVSAGFHGLLMIVLFIFLHYHIKASSRLQVKLKENSNEYMAKFKQACVGGDHEHTGTKITETSDKPQGNPGV